MIRETIVVFDVNGKAIYWHEPDDRSAGYVPDSDDLWDVLWEHRDHLGGYAHTHPGHGPVSPSGIDLTTFDAIEKGLGKQLLWPILSFDQMVCVVRNPLFKSKPNVTHRWTVAGPLTIEFDWVDELRRKSGSEEAPSPV